MDGFVLRVRDSQRSGLGSALPVRLKFVVIVLIFMGIASCLKEPILKEL